MKRYVSILIITVAAVLYYIQGRYIRITDYFMIETTTPKDFSQFTFEDDFLTKAECAELSTYIQNHPRMSESDLGERFKGTYGFQFTFRDASVKYDVRNIEKMTGIDLKPIYKIYNKIKHPGTNVCLFNPLLINTSVTESENSTAEPHYDTTINAMRLSRRVTPVCTTVVYIDVPDEFLWGRLALAKFGRTRTIDFAYIKPKVGRKVTFRGDAYHYVEPMYSEIPKKRISLVFEQYKLRPEEIQKFGSIEVT